MVLDVPSTLRLARHWLPQLAAAFVEVPHENVRGTEPCPMSPKTRAVLERLAADEAVLYTAALRRAEVMLESLPPEENKKHNNTAARLL